jgi:hypothetical protein
LHSFALEASPVYNLYRFAVAPEETLKEHLIAKGELVAGVLGMNYSHVNGPIKHRDDIDPEAAIIVASMVGSRGGSRLATMEASVARAEARAAVRSQTMAAAEIPTVTFSASRYPELAENIRNAQLAGHPEILTYGGAARANRTAALDGLYRIPRILSRDEYPFASTLEGGESSWVGHIPGWQNSAQGGVLSHFYRTNNIGPGSRFRVMIGD